MYVLSATAAGQRSLISSHLHCVAVVAQLLKAEGICEACCTGPLSHPLTLSMLSETPSIQGCWTLSCLRSLLQASQESQIPDLLQMRECVCVRNYLNADEKVFQICASDSCFFKWWCKFVCKTAQSGKVEIACSV